MPDPEVLKSEIRAAFADVQHPGDSRLRGSNEGDEPFLLEQEFKGKCDWSALSPEFIDQAPDGYSSALSFFSDEAFRFYLPAYLIADIDGRLDQLDPVFHLTHGLTDSDRSVRVAPQLYGDRTWFDEKIHKFAMFDHPKVAAIISYLRFKRGVDESIFEVIDQALKNYWLHRVNEQLR